MARHEPLDPLSEFDALLNQELSVTPSPEFLPRVRERVRLEPEPSRWRGFWLLAPLAAAATLVLATGAGLLLRENVAPPNVPAAPVVATAAGETLPKPDFGTLRRTSRVPSTETRVPRTETRVPSPENRKPSPESRTPEVLVDQRQRAALVALLRMASDGRVTEDSFKSTTPPPLEIGVDPVAVSPIVVGGVLPFETDRK